jgi:hypothetical protein
VLALQPIVQLRDANGAAVLQSGVSVSASVASGGGTLSGTTSVTTNSSGVASFTDLALTGTGAQTLRFAANGLTSATSSTITLSTSPPPPATKLAITTQPAASATSGVAFSTQPVVQLQDANGNAVSQSGVSVSATVASGGGTLSGITTVSTSASGAASFTNLAISGSGAQTIQFSATGLTSVTSATITVTVPPPTATKLAITTAPGSAAVSGSVLAPQPVIQLQDANGNAVSQSGVQIHAAIATGGGTLGGTTTVATNSSGSASFTDLAITGSGAQTIQFTATGLTSITSSTIAITLPPATKLAITTQPGATATSGAALSPQPVIQLQDANGNAVSQAGVSVTAAVASGGGTLTGTATVSTNATGAASFTNLAITGNGGQTILFTASGLTSVTSSTITLSPPPATKLAITTQPGATATSGAALSPQPVVQLQDASGKAVSQSGVQVHAAIASGGGTLGGTTTVATNASGAASFTNLAITGSGGQTIQFTATGLTSITSSTVTITLPPAAKLAITTQPGASATSGAALSPQPVVQLQDANGNAVSQSGVSVSAIVLSGGGTLSGTTTVATNTSGAAAFSDLAITGSGAQTLQFTASGLTSATSNTITVTSSGTGGTVLFSENFEDTNFGARGWYDLAGMTSLDATNHITGSGHSLAVNFAQGAMKPSPGVNARHQFTPTNSVYVRFWIKHSTNWVGSGQTYHPHEFYILSTLDDQYAGPSWNYLDVYIEDNWMSDGGHPLLIAQDGENIDVTKINQDLTNVTENRAVSGCNGNPDGTAEITCYQLAPDWYNGKTWRSAQPAYVNATGPNYKGDWHKVEAYYQLNSIVNGIGQHDGVAQLWVDGVLFIDQHNLEFRTGAHPTLQFNQFVMSPYIGDGSPVAQSLWYDDLVVMTAPPSP